MSQIKICGNYLEKDLELLAAVHDHIQYVGFIFTPVSNRHVSAQTVASWMVKYPFLKEKAVGVFLNQKLDEIIQHVHQVGIQHVQLHGDETPEFCAELKSRCEVNIWKAIPVENDSITAFTSYLPVVEHLLLDTKVKGQSGGTGQRFNWSFIPQVLQETEQSNIPLWVAGGINPRNVVELIGSYPIQGIDIASGVEGEQGKDKIKVEELLKEVQKNAATRRDEASS